MLWIRCIISMFFSKIYPSFNTSEAIFQKKFADRQWAVLVILPTATLSCSCCGLRRLGTKKVAKLNFDVVLWTNKFLKKIDYKNVQNDLFFSQPWSVLRKNVRSGIFFPYIKQGFNVEKLKRLPKIWTDYLALTPQIICLEASEKSLCDSKHILKFEVFGKK